MPRLILLNGPPGAGKSTLATMYADRHPLTLCLDIDRVRAMMGQWRDRAHAAGLLARHLSLVMARSHLASGYDVIIPQYLGRPQFIDQLERLAATAGAQFDEIVLWDDKESSLMRFRERSDSAADPAHVEAQELVDRAGGTVALAAMYERLQTVLVARPDAKVMRTRSGEVEQAYKDLLARLA